MEIYNLIKINDINNINLILETSLYFKFKCKFSLEDYHQYRNLYNFIFEFQNIDLVIDCIVHHSSNPIEILNLFIPILIEKQVRILQYWKNNNPLYDYLKNRNVNVLISAPNYGFWDAFCDIFSRS